MKLNTPVCLTVCLSAGHLSLSLDKDSFELLGVEGKPSRFNHRTTCRYGTQQNACAPYQMSLSCNSRLVKKVHLLNYCMYVCICTTVVCVDLTDSSMAPGGRGYQRLLTGLRSRLQLKTDFLLSHHPGESDIIRHGSD